MQHTDEGNGQQKILDEQRIAQVCATAHKDRGYEIRQERIGEAHSRISWILWRIVVAESKSGDHTQMKRQVAEIIEHTGVDAFGLHNHRAIEEQPHDHRHSPVVEKVNDQWTGGMNHETVDCTCSCLHISGYLCP